MIQIGMAALGALGLARGITGALAPNRAQSVNPQDFANRLRDVVGNLNLPSKAQSIFARLKAQPELVEYLSPTQKEELVREFKGALAEFTSHAGRIEQGRIQDVELEGGFMRVTIGGEKYELGQITKILQKVMGAQNG